MRGQEIAERDREAEGGRLLLAAFACLALGAGLMYYLDPDRGSRRRGLVRDKLIHWRRLGRREFTRTLQHMRGRLRGVAAAARGLFSRDHVEDERLAARVRAAIGRPVSHPHAIQVLVKDACVTLRGQVPHREIHDLLRTVARVRGVQRVRSALEPRPAPVNESVPGPSAHGRSEYNI